MSPEYNQWLADLKNRIQSAQIKAAVKVNTELLRLYWYLGYEIVQKEQTASYGSGLIPQLSKDLSKAFPGIKGFSKANLFHIRKWFSFYASEPEIVEQLVRQSGNDESAGTKVSQLVRQSTSEKENTLFAFWAIPWGHHLQILYKCANLDEARYYLIQTAAYNWSRNVLVLQIESGLYKRKGSAITNFEKSLPKPQSDLARELLKNPYNFDFLTLGDDAKERDLEDALIEHITSFLLELGQGFAYMGRQYKLQLQDEEYALDLLFYHTRLRCYVVIELKAGEFKPEYAGKLNFYLNLVDDFVRSEEDKPTLGMLLCRNTGGKLRVEYALRGIEKPIGVSEYQLTNAIPESLKGSLPTIEQIEEELGNVE